jgi:integrase
MATKKASWTEQLIHGKYVGLDDKLRAGTLEARLSGKGVMFFWRVDVRPKTYRYRIGPWDSSSPPLKAEPTDIGFSRTAAKACADAYASIHVSETWGDKGGYPARILAEETKRIADDQRALAQKQIKDLEEQANRTHQSYTLARLISEYVGHQERLAKSSAREAKNIFDKYILRANPQLATMTASDIDSEQIADAIRAVNEQGKGRTANKLRSYLRAAFAMAAKAKTNPAIPLTFKEFRIKHNPVSDVAVIGGANKTAKAPLSTDGLILYWRSIENLPGIEGHILRLHLMTGAQRIAQLCRLKKSDVQGDEIVLLDPKGKRQQARVHRVPLIKSAKSDIDALVKIQTKGDQLISTDGGATEAWASTVNDYAKRAMVKKGFTLKNTRSGVETLLSSKGVSREIRAQLQSHGLSGVQQASYDGHDYRREKLFALETLYSTLNQIKGPKVVNLR